MAMREEIRKAGLPIRIWPEGNGLVLETERPDLADLRAVTNALAGQEAAPNRQGGLRVLGISSRYVTAGRAVLR
jgi:hypothetical protein